MAEQPSYRSSTLSQAFIGSLAFYATILLLVTVGLIWANLDAEKAKLIVGWSSALQGMLTSAYLAVRKPGNAGGTNGQAPPVVPEKVP